jgi:tetratricopeptide (TPR) repeat protein
MIQHCAITARRNGAASLLLCIAIILGFVSAAAADDGPSRACRSKKAEDAIAGCTTDLKQPHEAANRAAILESRARAYEEQGMTDEAKADYDEAVALRPGFITWFNRGQFLLDANLFDQVADDLSQAITLYDRTPPHDRGEMTEDLYLQAHFQRGQALRRGEHYAEAVEDYSLVITAQPRNDVALTQRATAYWRLGKFDEDIADLTRFMALKRPDPVTLYNRGLAYARKGDDADALADFSDAVERSQGMASAYVARGSVLEHMGQPGKALADYRKAAQIDPKLPSATAAVARLGGQ